MPKGIYKRKKKKDNFINFPPKEQLEKQIENMYKLENELNDVILKQRKIIQYILEDIL